MKKRKLSPSELKRVIELKKLGANWTEIERETKVERRAAKREYEDWERDKKIEEQEAARFRVRAEAFHEHLNDLITLATSFVMNLDVLELPYMMEANAEQWLFDQDLLYRLPSISTEMMEACAPVSRPPVDMQSYRREQELLFECLKTHTREKVRWKAWDEWKEARDNCKRGLDKLWKKTSEVVNNFADEQETNFLQRVKEESGVDDVKRMAKAVLEAIWQGILEDNLEQNFFWVKVVSSEAYASMRDETILHFPDKSRAEKVTHICDLTFNNLCKGEKSHLIESLQGEVRTMENTKKELREKLNPVKLRPIILSTRCDLCPV